MSLGSGKHRIKCDKQMVHHLYYKQIVSLYQPLRVSSLWGTGRTGEHGQDRGLKSLILGANCQTPQLHCTSASAPVRIFPSYSVDEMN